MRVAVTAQPIALNVEDHLTQGSRHDLETMLEFVYRSASSFSSPFRITSVALLNNSGLPKFSK